MTESGQTCLMWLQSPTDDVASVSCAVVFASLHPMPRSYEDGPSCVTLVSLLPEPQRQLLARHAHLNTTHRNMESPC